MLFMIITGSIVVDAIPDTAGCDVLTLVCINTCIQI